MIEVSKASTVHTSDLASYASSYSMAENNFSSSQLPGSNSNGSRSSQNDDDRPKKVRLPSISSIASSLRQPLIFPSAINTNSNNNNNNNTGNSTSSSSPTLPNISYNQRAHSNPEINTLHVAAEIFTKNYNNNYSSSTPTKNAIDTRNASIISTSPNHGGQASSSHHSSPMHNNQHVTYHEPIRPPSHPHQQSFAPQYQQLPPPPQQAQQQPHPGHSYSPFPQGPLPQATQPQQSYYYSNPIEHIPHYTTTTQHHLSQQQPIHSIKPKIAPSKNNYNRRLSKVQHENKIRPQLYCQRCGITETPEWRKGPNGARTLCNACGLFHAKILKRDGPEAAANAINSNKVIKKNTFKRRSSVNDATLVHHFNHQQGLPQGFVTGPPPQLAQAPPAPNQQQQPGLQLLPPPVQHIYQNQQQQQPTTTVILPPGAQALNILPPSTGFPTIVPHLQHHQQQQQQPTQHINHYHQPFQHEHGIIRSPVSPSIHHNNFENINDRR